MNSIRFFFLFISIFALAQNNLLSYIPLTSSETGLINAGTGNEMMRVIQVTEPDELKILTTLSIDIDPKDPNIELLSKRMYQSVMNPLQPGVGIAAPQVGINRNAIWVMRFDKEAEPFEFMVNPVLVWKSDLKRKGKEGCLSIPDIYDDVFRHYAVRIQYYDLEGEFHDEIIEGFTAVILQHETDHLLGILFTERLKEQADIEYIPLNDQLDLYTEASRMRY